eukprot:SM000065S20248  [mRNA]  locus=s65:642042:643266:- [translate_table: standard]
MGNASSMLTQYDIEEVQTHCKHRFSQQEIVSLYERFCQLDRNGKGYISADEFMAIPEFALSPLSQRMLTLLEGVNFKDFVALLSAFSASASSEDKIRWIFTIYDSDANGKVSKDDIVNIVRDLSGNFLTQEQRQAVVTRALEEAGYSQDCELTLQDYVKVLGNTVKMEVEVPLD